MAEDDKPSGEKPDNKTPESKPMVGVRAGYTIEERFLRYMDDKGAVSEEHVFCRDINKILSENPKLVAAFRNVLCFDFFDVVRFFIYNEDTPVALDSLFAWNNSPRYFLPGRGKIYRLTDIKVNFDKESLLFKAMMIAKKVEACFVSYTGHILFLNPEREERVLDESEIPALGSAPLKPEEKIEGSEKSVKDEDSVEGGAAAKKPLVN